MFLNKDQNILLGIFHSSFELFLLRKILGNVTKIGNFIWTAKQCYKMQKARPVQCASHYQIHSQVKL